MPRLLKIALVTACLCAGLLLTLLAAMFGWSLWRPRGCGGSGIASARAQTYAGRAAVRAFVADWRRCPEGEYELVTAGYLERVRSDRWGQQLVYTCLEAGPDLIVTVRSAGPDRIFWTRDDIVSE